MVMINVLDHVPRCYTFSDGAVIGDLIRRAFATGERVTVSFAGVSDVPSSFVNAAFIGLLDTYSFDQIRQQMSVINSTRQINAMIRRRFDSEIHAHAA